MNIKAKSLLWVGLFAIAMAYLESAVVVYLRKLYGITDLILSVPPFDPQIGAIELGRELATLVMLLAVGWAAGKKLQSKLGVAIFAFGLWDIFYYFWLKVFINWPRSLLDMDILFLIPLPWWGPVLAPVLVALLMAVGGAILVLNEARGVAARPKFTDWGALVGGVLIMLYAFMADALAALPADAQRLSQLRPSEFNWPVFLIGYALTVLFVWRIAKPSPTIGINGG